MHDSMARRNAETIGAGALIKIDGSCPGVSERQATATLRPSSGHMLAGIKPAGIVGIVVGIGLAALTANWLTSQLYHRRSWVESTDQVPDVRRLDR